MVLAQHGTRESPCTFLDVSERETYSSTLDRPLSPPGPVHRIPLRRPTEIGGLVVDPAARASEALPGKQLSFVRFLYMAMHRDRFRETVLAELMPPLSKGGKSPFWESFGRRFTGSTTRTRTSAAARARSSSSSSSPPPSCTRRCCRRGAAGARGRGSDDRGGAADARAHRVPLRQPQSTPSTVASLRGEARGRDARPGVPEGERRRGAAPRPRTEAERLVAVERTNGAEPVPGCPLQGPARRRSGGVARGGAAGPRRRAGRRRPPGALRLTWRPRRRGPVGIDPGGRCARWTGTRPEGACSQGFPVPGRSPARSPKAPGHLRCGTRTWGHRASLVGGTCIV